MERYNYVCYYTSNGVDTKRVKCELGRVLHVGKQYEPVSSWAIESLSATGNSPIIF
jgi:hypothetical protein